MAHGVCMLLWIRSVPKYLGIECAKPMNLHCDNKAIIEIAQNPIQLERIKHVEVSRHFIKEKLDQQLIRFPFVK